MSPGARTHPTESLTVIRTALCRCGHMEQRHLHFRADMDCSAPVFWVGDRVLYCDCKHFRRERWWHRATQRMVQELRSDVEEFNARSQVRL